MHLAIRQPRKCALCAFQSSKWALLIATGGGDRREYRKWRSSQRDTFYSSKTTSKVVNLNPKLAAESVGTRRPGHRRILNNEDIPYDTIARLIQEQWSTLKYSLGQWLKAAPELESWGITTKQKWKKWSARFQQELAKCCKDAIISHKEGKDPSLLFERLRKAFIVKDVKGLAAAIKYSFANLVLNDGFSDTECENHRRLADLRNPTEWYPEARTMQRKIHLHVGPTNSGKTYQALQRLEAAESGIYAGPLRLLAHEVYTRLNAKNKVCALITGEERRIPEGQESLLRSCTVEMVPLNIEVDVAVIDEIQMMGDMSRGWAWTQAFLGVRAKEVHLCGELRTIPLIQQLCAMMGDSLEIHKYERLSPLKAMKSSLKGDLNKLEKGDAIILFSRFAIHAMKTEIENTTGRRCAVVYGSLPPETRAQQANLFNDPNNDYDFLVASDAVGMGLNLSIKRVVFETTEKFDRLRFRTLQVSEIKQIAGRAGRYRTASQVINNIPPLQHEDGALVNLLQVGVAQKQMSNRVGLVTTLEDYDMPVLQRAMSSEVPPLATAGLRPPDSIIARFAAYFPENTPLSYILLRLREISTVNPRFHICQYEDHIDIADAIQPYDLTINDRLGFIAAPASFHDMYIEAVIKAMAKCVADQSNGHLLDIKEIKLELLDEEANMEDKEYLRKLENLHKALTLYLWLSYRFAGTFRSQALAFHAKGLVEERIDACLAHVKLDLSQRKRVNALRQLTAQSSLNPAPKFEGSIEGKDAKAHPFSELMAMSEQKISKTSTPTYVDLGLEGTTWQASISVMYDGAVIQASGTGSSKGAAKREAAERVLERISVWGKCESSVDSSQVSHMPEEGRAAMPSAWGRGVQTSILTEGVSEGEGQRMPTIS